MIIACVLTIHVVLLSCNNWTYSKIWTGGPFLAAKGGPTSQKLDLAQFWQARSGPGPILAN